MSERPRSEKEARLGSAPASLQGKAALDQKVTRARPPGPALRDGKRAAYSHLQKENADTLGSEVGSYTFSCGKVKQTGLHHRMDSQKRSFGKMAICGAGSKRETDLAREECTGREVSAPERRRLEGHLWACRRVSPGVSGSRPARSVPTVRNPDARGSLQNATHRANNSTDGVRNCPVTG